MLALRVQLVVIALIAGTWHAGAQGRTELRTGGGPTSASHALLFPSSVDSLRLEFSFGFATDETPQTPGFLDSFTVTLQDNGAQWTAIYLTADANGVSWAPVTPGTIFMDPNSINRSTIPFDDASFDMEYAFRVNAPIPSQFAGSAATLYFDLFDNGNAIDSMGWFSEIVVVPEPDTVVLGVLGGTILVFFVRHRGRNFLR